MKRLLVLFSLCALALMVAPTAQASFYVGSEQCFQCHQNQYNDWQSSGHPWKLRKAAEAKFAKLPLPKGYAWRDISYVIGGANKKSRYIDLNGFIITSAKDGSEAKTQYNLDNGSWSFYHKGQKKPYKCGPCHMTAYNPGGHQDGLPGMIGTWIEDGIGCEECHGPGSDHITDPAKNKVTVDSSAIACGKCHQRGGIGPKPPASGGFIRHHEQINELLAGSHKELDCVECHDPHQRAIMVDAAKCAECHDGETQSFAKSLHGKSGISCIECHMPKVTKSAIAEAKYVGDVRTHIFKINTDANGAMFTTVEKDGTKSSYANGAVTLEFACLQCHGSRDKKWAAKYAGKIH